MKPPSVEDYLTPIHESAAKNGLKVINTGKRSVVSNGPFIDKSDPRWVNAEFEEVVIQPLTPEKFNHIHKVFFTDPPKDAPRFSFDPEMQSWRPHEEIKDCIPRLIQTASPTPSETE